jgi:hypothetical protein
MSAQRGGRPHDVSIIRDGRAREASLSASVRQQAQNHPGRPDPSFLLLSSGRLLYLDHQLRKIQSENDKINFLFALSNLNGDGVLCSRHPCLRDF